MSTMVNLNPSASSSSSKSSSKRSNSASCSFSSPTILIDLFKSALCTRPLSYKQQPTFTSSFRVRCPTTYTSRQLLDNGRGATTELYTSQNVTKSTKFARFNRRKIVYLDFLMYCCSTLFRRRRVASFCNLIYDDEKRQSTIFSTRLRTHRMFVLHDGT